MIQTGDFKIGLDERLAIERVLDSGRVTEGVEVSSFEREFADYVGKKYAVACSSGWAALVMALSAAKELLYMDGYIPVVPALTYIATASACSLVFGDVGFADVDPSTMCMTEETYKQSLAFHTYSPTFPLPVDLMGYVANMPSVIEDACEAHGAMGVGKSSIMQCYSFYMAHNIQAGELGCVTTDDEDTYRYLKSIKAQGRVCDCRYCSRHSGYCPHADDTSDPRFTHQFIGFNFKTMEFPAALARVQLKRADDIIEARRDNFNALNHRLAGHPGFDIPLYQIGMSPMAFPIVLHSGVDREKFQKKLLEQGVESRPLFGSIPTQQEAYANKRGKYIGRLPNADRLGKQGLYVGVHQYLGVKEIDRIADAIIDSVEWEDN